MERPSSGAGHRLVDAGRRGARDPLALAEVIQDAPDHLGSAATTHEGLDFVHPPDQIATAAAAEAGRSPGQDATRSPGLSKMSMCVAGPALGAARCGTIPGIRFLIED
jgi:hypothetical protein